MAGFCSVLARKAAGVWFSCGGNGSCVLFDTSSNLVVYSLNILFFYNLLLLYFVRYAEAIVSFFSSRYPRAACKKYYTLTTLFYKK